jgi:competence protein ComEC
MLSAYVMLVGCPPSAVRAGVMSSMYLGAYLFGRKPDSVAAWGIAAIVIFGVSPEMLLDIGCMLSFSVMLGIVLWIRWSGQFASPLDGLMRLAAVEAALECQRRKKIILWIHARAEWILCALGISFAAWIAAAPIAVIAFGRLALGSLLINVAVVPLAGMAVAFAVFGMIASVVLPQIGVFFNNLSAVSIYLMSLLSESVVKIPYSSVETIPWSLMDCLMWYMAWIAFFILAARHFPRREFIYVRNWEKGDD